MEVCEEAPQGGAPPAVLQVCAPRWVLGLSFQGLQGERGRKQRAAHLEPVRGLFLQGFLKVKISSYCSCSL